MDLIKEYKQEIKRLKKNTNKLMSYNVHEDTKNRIKYNKELINTYEQEIIDIKIQRKKYLQRKKISRRRNNENRNCNWLSEVRRRK